MPMLSNISVNDLEEGVNRTDHKLKIHLRLFFIDIFGKLFSEKEQFFDK